MPPQRWPLHCSTHRGSLKIRIKLIIVQRIECPTCLITSLSISYRFSYVFEFDSLVYPIDRPDVYKATQIMSTEDYHTRSMLRSFQHRLDRRYP